MNTIEVEEELDLYSDLPDDVCVFIGILLFLK